MRILIPALLAGLLGATAVHADTTVPMYMATEKGQGQAIGEVTLSDSKYGLVFTPKLTSLPAGVHGFHVHAMGSCDAKEDGGKMVPAGAAGGHLDPQNTKKHGMPWDDGAHLGDLPPLIVDAQGNAMQPVLAPRLKLASVSGKALMVHAGGDNHSDHPAPLGGGGARQACGVIK